MAAMSFAVEPLTPTIGAEIVGLDLTRPLTPEVLDQVYQALLDHQVIFLRDQEVTPAAQLTFAESFGAIDRPHPIYPCAEGHPNVVLLQNGPDKKPDTNLWHTDLTFYPEPPFASLLYGKEVPASGGDTLWASMYAAFEALPTEIKAHLEGLQAVHDMGDFRNDYLQGTQGGVEALNVAMARLGSAVHPVVQCHPVTGRRFLYVNQAFTRQIVGQNMRESDRLLRYLYDHMERPEFQVRFRWWPGSLAMWDNRVTQHYAVSDYHEQQNRTMHRVTVVTDRRAAEGWKPAARAAE